MFGGALPPHRCHCWKAEPQAPVCAVWPGSSASWPALPSPSAVRLFFSPPTHTAAAEAGSWSAGVRAQAPPVCELPTQSPALESPETKTSSPLVPRGRPEVLLILCVAGRCSRLSTLNLSQLWIGWGRGQKSVTGCPSKCWNERRRFGRRERMLILEDSQSSVGAQQVRLSRGQWLQALYCQLPVKQKQSDRKLLGKLIVQLNI